MSDSFVSARMLFHHEYYSFYMLSNVKAIQTEHAVSFRYVGELSRDIAGKILECLPNGTFLVRQSISGGEGDKRSSSISCLSGTSVIGICQTYNYIVNFVV